MTHSIDFTGWTRRDGELWLDGYEDVRVWFDNYGNDPFGTRVGQSVKYYLRLEEAMACAQAVAEERAFLIGSEPLPVVTPEGPGEA